MKKKLFIDSDGTLFQFPSQYTLYDLTTPHFFENLYPYENVVEGLREFHQEHPEIELYIATHVLSDESSQEKMKCYQKHHIFDFIKKDNVLFIPYGTDKNIYVQDFLFSHNSTLTDCYLLDDYTPNLLKWEDAGGQGIKIYNGVNGQYGRWKGYMFHYDMPAWMISHNIEKAMNLEDIWGIPSYATVEKEDVNVQHH